MQVHGPLAAGLVVAASLVVSPGALAVVCVPPGAAPKVALARIGAHAPVAARGRAPQDAAANDAYNFIAGLFEKGFHDRVVAEGRKFLAAHASHARAPLVRYRLGQSLFELKKYPEAQAELAKLEPAPRDFPYATEVSFRLAQCALELGDPAGAAKRFDAIAAAKGDDGGEHYLAPAAAFHAGEAHFRTGAFAAAAKAYAKAVQGGSDEYAKSALHGLGWALYKAGEFDSAATSLQLFVQKHPQDPAAGEAQFLLGECRLKSGKPQEAVAAFQKVPQGEWFDDALSAAGFACAAIPDDAKAAQWFLRLEQAAPESPLLPEARLHAGIHLQRTGKSDESAAVLDRLLAGDAGALAGEAWYWRGAAERKRGGEKVASRTAAKAAATMFERGLATKPGKELEQRLALARADALFDAGEFDAAKEAYAKAGGASEEAACSAAVAALNGGDHDGAIERAKDYLARYGGSAPRRSGEPANAGSRRAAESTSSGAPRSGAPASGGAHRFMVELVLGEAYFAKERWSDALPAFEEAARVTDDAPEGRATLRPRALSRAGWCCFKLGRFDDAAQRFAALASEFPQDERAAEASFMAGRAALRAGDPKAGEAALAKHLEQFPKSEWADDARYDLAQCQRAQGREAEAQKLLAQLARGGGAVDPALARRAALETAELAAAEGRHEDALAALVPIVDGRGAGAGSAPPSGTRTANAASAVPLEMLRPALYAQAWSLFALQRFDEAGAALGRLLATESKDAPLAPELAAPAHELAASVARARKDGAAARSAYARLLAIAPSGERTPEVALVAALALEDSGDPRSAAAVLEDALQRWPKFSGRDRLLYQRALALQKSGEEGQAKALLAKLAGEMAQSPLAAQAAFELGERAYAAGEWDAALASYAQASGDGSSVADAALYKSAWCRFQKGEFAAAAQAFGEVPRRFEKSALAGESRFLMGESLVRAGEFERAAAQLEEFLRLHPKHEARGKALFRLGVACGELGRMDACGEALARLEREFPDFELRAEADLWLGRALLAKQRTNDALAKFDAVIAADRGVLAARAHLGRGDALLAQGRLDDALGEYLKVSLLFKSDAEVARALYQSGQVLEQLNDPEKAKARYRELLEHHPKSPDAPDARARLKELETKSF